MMRRPPISPPLPYTPLFRSISVDDDGAQGIVTIGAVEAWRMEEAKAAILAIVDPAVVDLAELGLRRVDDGEEDRKSTRLNSSHVEMSYAVFWLKKKTGLTYP